MKKYTENDIKVIEPRDHILKNQHLYFGPKGANPECICSGIMDGALIIGSKRVYTEIIDDWYLVCGSPDWFDMIEIPYKDSSKLFVDGCGFPEAGPNRCRFEVMVGVFSSRAFTYANNTLQTITGKPLSEEELSCFLESLGRWDRIIGFQFCGDPKQA